MLFNSYEFIFIFLPLVVILFYQLIKRYELNVAICWLIAASLFFYGWWNPIYLLLILLSIVTNYSIGKLLYRYKNKLVLIVGVLFNLGILVYFKYYNFFLENINFISGSSLTAGEIILPLAISFYTFQQIAYLVDTYRSCTYEHSFMHYCFFVTFFPQLIAGPIVHHREIMPQLAVGMSYLKRYENLSIGLTIFFLGLFKKVVIADGMALYADPVFSAAESDAVLSVYEAWVGAIAYTFQLYFDFSGYSDMAVGLARMFGVKLPVNFLSPYKSNSIIDFWKRWHITLSRFLKDYLYIPLGGNRRGVLRRYLNLLITMILGGLWHGAEWTFVLWGVMHGLLLMINYGWRHLSGSTMLFCKAICNSFFTKIILSRLTTFIALVVSWVLFRAETIYGAVNIYEGMFLLNGLDLPGYLKPEIHDVNDFILEGYVSFNGLSINNLVHDTLGCSMYLFILMIVVMFFPNTYDFMRKYEPVMGYHHYNELCISNLVVWRPTMLWGVIIFLLGLYSIGAMGGVSEFLYFQF